MTQALVEAPVEQATVVPLPQLLEREDYTPNTLPFIPRNQLEKRQECNVAVADHLCRDRYLPLPNASSHRGDLAVIAVACLLRLTCSGQPTYPALEDWIQIFRQSIASFRRTAEADSSLPEAERLAAAERFASAYLAIVNEVEQDALAAGAAAVDGSSRGQQPGCLELCQLRLGLPGRPERCCAQRECMLCQASGSRSNGHMIRRRMLQALQTPIGVPVLAANVECML